MISRIRAITRLCIVVAIAVGACVYAAPAIAAAVVTYVSGTGSDSNACTAMQPCATIFQAAVNNTPGGQINCLDTAGVVTTGFQTINSYGIDCAGTVMISTPNFGAFKLSESAQTTKIRSIIINGSNGGYPAISVLGSGSLILENCDFENIGTGAALDIEPNGPLNLVIVNSRISSSGSGVLLKPAAGGSINATFDHVTIAGNTGGGIKLDTTNGPITADITDSAVSDNGGNGINAVGGTGGPNMVSIKNSVVAKNGVAGVQANGASAAILIQTTLLDQNASGATSVVSGGHISTYGNNSIVGGAGSGFTSTAGLQ